MLLILLIFIAIVISLWLPISSDDSFFENAAPLCFGAVLAWLIIILFLIFIFPTFNFETEVKIDGYHYDPSFPSDSLSYIIDGECFRVSGDVTIFEGGSKDTLVIKENYIDVPDWFWLISFIDVSDKPWSTDYFIR